MSNLANTIQYLKGKDNRFITITVQETNTSIGKANVYLTDIPGEDLEQYLKNSLGPISKPTLVWVEMRSKVGPSSKKDHACAIEVSPANYQPETPTPTSLPAIAPVAPLHYPQPMPQDNTPTYLGSPSMGGNNVFGLGFAEVVTMQVKADRLSHKEEQLADLKEDFRELKQKYNLLDIDHRITLTKLSTAEAQKDMAVMLAKSENKSIFESAAFEKLMEQAPQLLSGFAAIKGGGALPTVAGVLGSPMPDGHKEFVEYVVENLDENQVNFLGSVCHFMNNDGFVAQLQMLITQYSALSHA